MNIPFRYNTQYGYFEVDQYNTVRYHVQSDGSYFEKHGVAIIQEGFAKFILKINKFTAMTAGCHEPYDTTKAFYDILKEHLYETCPKAFN